MNKLATLDHRHAASIETTLEFLNTDELDGSGQSVENLPTLADATAWLVEHGLLYPEESAPLGRLGDRDRTTCWPTSMTRAPRSARSSSRWWRGVRGDVRDRERSTSCSGRARSSSWRWPTAPSSRGIATSGTRSKMRSPGSWTRSSSRSPPARPSGSGSARTMGVAGSSRTRVARVAGAGAAWPAAATGPRRPAIGRACAVSRRRPPPSIPDRPGTRGPTIRPGSAPSPPSAIRSTSGAMSRRPCRARRRRGDPGPTTPRRARTTDRAIHRATPTGASSCRPSSDPRAPRPGRWRRPPSRRAPT